MTIVEWFDVNSLDHLKAWVTLENTGMWPEDFIPKDIVFPTDFWHISIVYRLADAYMKSKGVRGEA